MNRWIPLRIIIEERNCLQNEKKLHLYNNNQSENYKAFHVQVASLVDFELGKTY